MQIVKRMMQIICMCFRKIYAITVAFTVIPFIMADEGFIWKVKSKEKC